MKFKYSAFTENTPEMMGWLESIGYKICPCVSSCLDDWLFTSTYGTIHSVTFDWKGEFLSDNSCIDCRSNPPLFQAVTAISTTTDIGKHYINNHTGQWKRCDYNMATDENIDWNDLSEATIEELTEKFKSEKK